MLQAVADTLVKTRNRMAGSLSDLTQEQWFKQPDGFANNIAWNVGHLITAQQFLCYHSLGVAGYAAPEMRGMYGGGTSPADWKEQPDTAELLRLFVELPQRLSADIAAGKFENYVRPEPVEGQFPPPESVAHAFVYNQHHEGLHNGTIIDLLSFVR